MRRFYLKRNEDVSGVSGTGRVAEGIEFDDTQCVLSWFGRFHTIEIAPTVDALIEIHGHGGKSEIEWIDD